MGFADSITISNRSPRSVTTIWRPLFDSVFASSVYKRFTEGEEPNLLRVLGGPGSGKTSFSTLVVQDLSQPYNADEEMVKPTVVLPVFLQLPNPNRPDEPCAPFTVRFLLELQRQIDSHLNLDASLSPPASPQIGTDIDTQTWQENLLHAIGFKLHRFGKRFLVVDQADLLLQVSPAEYHNFENEVLGRRLREDMHVNVMITSRISFKQERIRCDLNEESRDDDSDDEGSHCDSESACEDQFEHSETDVHHGLMTWWRCEDSGHQKDTFDICERCRDAGRGCGHDLAMFTYHTRPLYLDFDRSDESAHELFVLHHLQLEHGRFWPGRLDEEEYPPLSPFGKRLLSKDGKAVQAKQLLHRILSLANGNISIALERIRFISDHAETSNTALALHDRLPPGVVAMFQALLLPIQRQAIHCPEEDVRKRAALGLHAIRFVGKSVTGKLKLESLRRKLIREDEGGCKHGFVKLLDVEPRALDMILIASAGLLGFEILEGISSVMVFTQNFHMFVKQDYNKEMARGCMCKEMGAL
ncbi:hypothetical protein QBC40DRAFT_229527 [Triangularia verruculosa]|uniref:Uncharacterized protein n=1 Tax=Triangularia verruculosa TaxID=2587418 RepID=A0AAN7ARQ0_9PEZI|nr:hypothetical protein QBC40DRAFT_229527 [Triangularia verruculosa]